MSFYRFVYYSAVVAGWMALAAWMGAEWLILPSRLPGGTWKTAAAAMLLGAMIAAGLGLVSGMTNALWRQQLRRIVASLIAGAVGGLVGGLLGELLYAGLGLPRFLGWMIMGLGIGIADGLYDRSRRKIRNGLIGGAIGGLLGGLLFDLIASASADMAGRATGFVILGLAVGLMVGLAQVVFKEAWLTVLDGYRPGRQLILGRATTILGRGDHLQLPFLGYSGRDLENEHLLISRQPDGNFTIQDARSRAGTLLNGRRLSQPAALQDGDLIKLGGNIVRFNHRQRTAAETPAGLASRLSSPAGAAPTGAIPRPPAPPPVPGSVAASPAAPAATGTLPLPQPAKLDRPSLGEVPRIPPPPPPPPLNRDSGR
jgi:hypothetical protein